MPLPLLLLLDKKIRKDDLKIGLLFLETMGTTGALYTSSAMIVNRFRPYAYNPEVSMKTRTRGGARNSFYAGHPSVMATSTFFMAKVFSDYHPAMKHKWILYALAGSATATTGLLRLKAGQHFKTDVIKVLALERWWAF
jgi:membrane-associated phospholipid phosphatase